VNRSRLCCRHRWHSCADRRRWLIMQMINTLSKDRETPTDVAAPPVATMPAGAVAIGVYSSDTKQDWMNQAVEAFNAGGHTVGGKPM